MSIGDGQDAGGGPLGITILGREIEKERVGARSTGAARLGARLRFGIFHASNLHRTPVAVTGCGLQMQKSRVRWLELSSNRRSARPVWKVFSLPGR
jgi:hypothetical protein